MWGDSASFADHPGLKRALELGPEGVLVELGRHALHDPSRPGKSIAELWWSVRKQADKPKYSVLRAFDADPWSRRAQVLWENHPHLLLEGFLVASYALGATRGFVCVDDKNAQRAEFVRAAVAGAAGQGFLRAGWSDGEAFEVVVREVPQLLVLGEDTALARVLEDRQALPYVRTAGEMWLGLLGGVGVIVEAETAVCVARVLRQEASAAQTAICTVWDEDKLMGTLEVSGGVSVAEVAEQAGQFACAGDSDADWRAGIQAVQIGGSTGPLLSPGELALSVDAALAKQERLGGSCTLRIFRSGCPVKRALKLMSYLQSQSCGQCVFCREGLFQIVRILKALVEGSAQGKDLELLQTLGESMIGSNICRVGDQAPAPLLSSLQLFFADFEAHAEGKTCPYVSAELR
ncbi:MAG: hypothetical protein N3B14_02470 [Thermoleophilia bacterium]|nr:hypothetical protein [Thermoleophilia bacterium]